MALYGPGMGYPRPPPSSFSAVGRARACSWSPLPADQTSKGRCGWV